jgi:tight adherence protein B
MRGRGRAAAGGAAAWRAVAGRAAAGGAAAWRLAAGRRAAAGRAAAGGALLAAVLLAAPALAAGGRGDLRVELRDADTAAAPGHLLATVSLSGSAWDGGHLAPGAFTAMVDGRPATVGRAEPLAATGRRLAVMLVVDTSGSMLAGGNIALARAAADRFATELRDGTRIGVIAFATRPRVVQPLTTDRRRVRAAIAGLRAAGDTALRDAVVRAAGLLAREAGQRTMVLLSDGRDDGSRATFRQAVAAARAAKVAVYTIGLTVPGYEQDPEALRELSRRTGVTAVTGASGADLAGLYQRLGQELASQYVVEVALPAGTPRTAAFELTVDVGGTSRTVRRTLLLGPPAAGPAPPPGLSPAPALAWPERAHGRHLVAALAFVATLLAGLALLAATPGPRLPVRGLRKRLSPYSLTPAVADRRPTTVFGSSELAGRATAMAESLVRRGHLEETFLDRLEAAGLNLRVAEFLLISLGCAFGLPLLTLAATRSLPLTLATVPLGVAVPLLFLSLRAGRRQARFEEQLPGTLHLLAGALQAGHSLQQAVVTAAQEAGDPIAGELQRVLTEARLGRPLEEAFDAMAERMGSLDFKWTVMAINLQRQVGGNLAEVLTTVGQTIRERSALKRQVRALSAEGRLSCAVLTVLPVLMFGALLVFNPVFLSPLYTTRTGLLMLAAAGVLMAGGVAWMKKLTEIEV